MNIWDAYCNPAYYNIYFDLLVAKGMKREDAERIKERYNAYVQRIKKTCFAQELKVIDNTDMFLSKLHDIFEIKWGKHLKYKEIPLYFYNYLKFLDSMQALHNSFFNNEEKKRIKAMADSELEVLSEYETEYMKNGKLVALMNPGLLLILHELITEQRLSPPKASLVCLNFYKGLVDMSAAEYALLIQNLWSPSRRIKKGGKHNMIKLTYPDGCSELYGTLDALKKIVLFYGFDEVCKKKLLMRNELFVCKNIAIGRENIYDSIEQGLYINNKGDAKDRLNLARLINKMFGSKLSLDME